MQSKQLIARFQELLNKYGVENASISENKNELADIMIYENPTGIDELALHQVPLFPTTAVKNILYQHGEGRRLHYYPN